MSIRSVAEAVYAKRLRGKLLHIPSHVAIIQDGNRRFAKSRGMDTSYGHRLGADTSERVLDWMGELGIRHVTFFAFSTENFRRPEEEKAELHLLFMDTFSRLLTDERVYKNEINITIIGDRALLDDELLQIIEETEVATKDHSRFFVHIAIAYGGRNEIVATAKKIVAAVRDGSIPVSQITPELVTENMYQGISMPPVDLIIRTANDRRTSNFLPWMANGNEAAVCFCTPTWPEFRYVDMLRALRVYDERMSGLSA
ncbi:polyprenyl diphosphate synthase [Methanorbis furvi]|uniref:Tritrans,polycis-undecaprenyl-diphosphate synthase (geranylgeranyl-diphosphate specific) n=1 Tax=Methanorbis furvi TaxID=3028299 RepID=A0AAE4MC86_9EURY|nr:(2Z,6E)-farnesyl diphosphate synthase [Methanocorpusculaceae archaeon Ag1]